MKPIKYIIPLLLCLVLNIAKADAQEIKKDKMDVKMNMSHKQDGKIDVTLTFVIPPKLIDADGAYTFTPTIIGTKGEKSDLPKILINGSKKGKKYYEDLQANQKVESDEAAKNLPEILVSSKEGRKYYKLLTSRKKDDLTDDNFHTAINYNNKDTYTITYKAAIAYERWMNGANLEVIAEPHDAAPGDISKETVYFPLGTIPISEASEDPEDAKAKTTRVKTHIDNKQMYLTFPVNSMVLLPEYGSNKSEMDAVEKSIRKIQSNELLDIKNISVTAYSSPEGDYENNAKLSLGRSLAFADYLKRNFNLDSDLVKVSFIAEDWDGVVSMVEADKILTATEKRSILNIIASNSDIGVRKNKLKAYAGGRPYLHMRTNLYPKLRHIHCDIEYEEQVLIHEEN